MLVIIWNILNQNAIAQSIANIEYMATNEATKNLFYG
jgi:hypothetical protein